METLPPELIEMVFGFVDSVSLLRSVSLVSRSWRSCLVDCGGWNNRLGEEFGIAIPPQCESFGYYIATCKKHHTLECIIHKGNLESGCAWSCDWFAVHVQLELTGKTITKKTKGVRNTNTHEFERSLFFWKIDPAQFKSLRIQIKGNYQIFGFQIFSASKLTKWLKIAPGKRIRCKMYHGTEGDYHYKENYVVVSLHQRSYFYGKLRT